MDIKQRERFETDLQEFADRYSLTRVKTESLLFDHDYQRAEDNSFSLVYEKAVIKTLGKVTKVKIGQGETYETYEAAAEAVRAHWSAYFKARRDKRTAAERRGEARRQRVYRERRKEVDWERETRG